MKYFFLMALILTGCSKAAPKPTTYYCLSPAGWLMFTTDTTKVLRSTYGTVYVETESQMAGFTACYWEREK